ncbi:kinesin [Curvularia clavata]|uniref:Kinesin n=1 Tax=Curvularia clavata TaxID=95742 RepID=A0A9Q8Z688_CURCL|nr:kinesin [Curvularia clavata]
MASATSFGDANAGLQAGIINGPVSAAFQLPPERRETPPPPSIVIPFRRDADFIERGTILDRVEQICAATDGRAALVGLGGVGKSQLAIEYAYRTRERSPETWVFWVYASNAVRFEQSYREIANRVKLTGREDPQTNIFELVYNWLCSTKQQWLLVLDNIDDSRFLLDHGTANPTTVSKPLRDYLQYGDRGSILVTTRNKETALELVEQRNVIMVEPLDKASAVALLRKKLGVQSNQQDNKSDVAELAAALECMPLAIVQAAAYISQRAPRCSVEQYLEEFQRSEHEETSLLDYEAGQIRRDKEAKNSIIVTWQISFEHLRQIRSSATDLLSFMSFCDRQGIPEALIRCEDGGETDASSNISKRSMVRHLKWLRRSRRGESKDQQDHKKHVNDSRTFDDDILALRNFCFISVDGDGENFEMHALVQLATRRWLAANGELERWKQKFISNLSAAFPTGAYENWAACQTLFVHAKSAATLEPEAKSSQIEWATLLYNAAWYAWQKGSVVDCENLAVNSMNVRRKLLGSEHKDTLSSMGMVGLAYILGGRWREAAEIGAEKMVISMRTLGLDHLNTLTAMHNLAFAYWSQGRWDEAENLYKQVLEMRKTKLSADHPDTLNSMDCLASTYRSQGRWKDAEDLEVEVLETSKKKLGVDHPSTLASMSSLASTYLHQGRLYEAEDLYKQALEMDKTKLGAEHPYTLTSMAGLASTYRSQGRWKDAEELEVEVLGTNKIKLGADHPSTLTVMNNLALTYWNQKRWDEAEDLQVQALEMRKMKLGADHPDTLTSMSSLASTYREQGRWDEAEILFMQVIETSKAKLRADHPSTLTSMRNLASTYMEQGRWDEAETLFVQVMETSKTKLGADHPTTLFSMHSLAFTWKAQGRIADAIALMSQCLQQRQRVLKASHPDVQSSLAAIEQWEAE